MNIKKICLISLFSCFFMWGQAIQKPDTIATKHGKVIIHFIGHGSLYLDYKGKIIHIDPFSKVGDYTTLPKADLILVTHNHYDHFDVDAISKITKDITSMIFTEACEKEGKYKGKAEVLKNGDKKEIMGITIEAVPAYNIVNKRPDENPFHPVGEGNGYVLNIDGKRIYIAGDTENIPEMAALKDIDIAFLPVNMPYTMTPEMAADAALKFNPKILYPYHFGETDLTKLGELLANSNIEIRIRDMK
jgi:L-ascorbate metabolism protein UlaG (beta-lactamase superfamily)